VSARVAEREVLAVAVRDGDRSSIGVDGSQSCRIDLGGAD